MSKDDRELYGFVRLAYKKHSRKGKMSFNEFLDALIDYEEYQDSIKKAKLTQLNEKIVSIARKRGFKEEFIKEYLDV